MEELGPDVAVGSGVNALGPLAGLGGTGAGRGDLVLVAEHQQEMVEIIAARFERGVIDEPGRVADGAVLAGRA